MRDDIHKGAPVSRRWRLFIKHSASEATWTTKSPVSAQEAVTSVAREIQSSTLTAIEGVINAPQLVIGGPKQELEQIRVQRPLTTLENCLFDRLIDSCSTEFLSTSLLSRAVREAISERIEAHMRAIEVHIQVESPRDRPELMRRMRDVLRQVDLEATCAEVLERRVPRPKGKEVFDWNESVGVRQ